MRLRRLLAVSAIPLVAAFGITVYANAASGTQAVECSSDGTTLSCPLPAPVTVTATVTKTKRITTTVTAQPTSPSTVVSTSETTSAAPTTSDDPTTSADPTTTSADPTTTSADPSTTSADPTTSSTVADPPSDWPGPNNTGVPAGTTLTDYTGSCTITTAGTVIDSKTVNCLPDGVVIRAANVTIKNSKVNGRIDVDTDFGRTWSLTLTDSEVDAGPYFVPTIYNGNVVIERANIHGGQNGLQCEEHAAYCIMRDSWIHDQHQEPNTDNHLGGVLALGSMVPCTGTDGACVELVHNTVVCDAPVNSVDGGCTADIALIPHFGPMPKAIVKDNYMGANIGSAYCAYGGDNAEYPASHISFIGNVFQRGTNGECAYYGPDTSFDVNAAGNVWQDNNYDDGTPVQPED